MGSREKKNFRKIAASVTSKVEKVGVKAKKSVSSLKLVSREWMTRQLNVKHVLHRIKTEVAWNLYLKAASGQIQCLTATQTVFIMRTPE